MKKSMFFILLIHLITAFAVQGQKTELLQTALISPKIDSLVQAYLDLDIFSGVVLVAEKGKPVYHKAFGLANRATQKVNTLNTKFDIGSMNKTFTKVVILQLLEEGKLKLSDKLGTYLSGFPKEAAENITIAHLLNHTSGFGDYHSPEHFDLPLNQKTITALVERIKQMPLMFEPGIDQMYSNTGYILLGAIIEKITGQTYHQNVKDRIVLPLNLKEIYLENKNEVPDRAIGYFKTMSGELMDNSHFVELPNPDGGFQSTASDILTFYREFHYGEKLLKYDTKMQDDFFQMIQPHQTSGGAIPHAGGFNGANTVNFAILRDDIFVIVFANMDEPVAEQVGAGILAIIRGQTPKQPVLPARQLVYQAYQQHGIDYVQQHFEGLTSNFHPGDPKDLILNNMGYELLQMDKVDQAIEIFELNASLFPAVGNVWDSLGEAYLKKGDRKKALEHYKKALAVDPGIPSARKMVGELEGQ
jgi:CubicO group peptidase (beta-lactamase class C family)